MTTSGHGWIETYRGTVFRWEVDQVDHFTVAYYAQRFGDATLGLLEAIGLGPAYMRRTGRGCVTTDSQIRYFRELRAGDILHIDSAVRGADAAGVRLGHRLFDSGTGTLCATVEAGTRHVELAGRTPVALAPAQEAAARARQVAWDGPAPERRPVPAGDAGFVDSGRDTVKPWEIDAYGEAAPSSYIHRFSAANGHAVAALGMTPAYQREQRRGFSTFEFQLRFFGGLRAGDLVTLRTGLLHVGTSSLRVFHRMSNAGTGELVATLDQLGVHLDMDARRPAPLPETLRERALALLVPLPAS